MGEYKIVLDDDQELFLKWYLREYPLREQHTPDMYPGLIAVNFINGMRSRMLRAGRYCPRCVAREDVTREGLIGGIMNEGIRV